MKSLHRLLILFCVFALISGSLAMPVVAASPWPENIDIAAEGGILMDANSGTILYGKNIHNAYFPASITKILTALIVIENCSLNETVTFSHDAVFNVETGSSSAALDVGDQLSVRDCLYAMLLKSANESANALAEHTAGSIETFAAMMNARAAELGCTDSHFNNPSGLNDPNHYTSAHDMALIAQAAFQNETFVEIDSTLYYDLPVTKRNHEGLRIYPGHRMLKKNTPQYYPGIIGGKTGYTSLAGNTLVTCAQQNGMKLIAVVLNGHQTHYTDTKKLLDFGFQNFKNANVSDIDSTYASVKNDMTIAGLPTTDLSVLQLEDSGKVIIPISADYADIISEISYNLPVSAPEQAIAQISYRYNGHTVGSAYLLLNEEGASATSPAVEVTKAALETDVPLPGLSDSDQAAKSLEDLTDLGQAASEFEDFTEPDQRERLRIVIPEIHVPHVLIQAAVIALSLVTATIAIIGFTRFKRQAQQQEEAELMARSNRRRLRLQDIGVSSAEFDLLLEQKRSSSTISGSVNKPAKKPKHHKSFLDQKSWK